MSESDKSYLEMFLKLELLSLSDCGIISLVNFPRLPSLLRLELTFNRIEEGLEMLQSTPNIIMLKLRHNKISKFDSLVPLQLLRNLIHLELFDNPICEEKGYRRTVFQIVEQILSLDNREKGDLDVYS